MLVSSSRQQVPLKALPYSHSAKPANQKHPRRQQKLDAVPVARFSTLAVVVAAWDAALRELVRVRMQNRPCDGLVQEHVEEQEEAAHVLRDILMETAILEQTDKDGERCHVRTLGVRCVSFLLTV